MKIERTFIMLKPDCIERGLIGKVILRIEDKGYTISDMRMEKLDGAFIQVHYSHLRDRPFFPELSEYMTSGPVIGMIVEGENAIMGMRKIIGATKFEDCAAGTIRGDYASCSTKNVAHASDSPENAEIEINRFFGDSRLPI